MGLFKKGHDLSGGNYDHIFCDQDSVFIGCFPNDPYARHYGNNK